MSQSTSRLGKNTINHLVRKAEYAVRGPVVVRAQELQAQLASNQPGIPFDKIISCNIGNPQALMQQPVSYVRDVLSIVMNPSLKDRAPDAFTKDVKERSEKYLNAISSCGSYSESQGIKVVRDEVANFLTHRDGHVGDASKIFLTNGASEGVRLCMQVTLRDPSLQDGNKDGILCPIPQYPLYSALTTLLNGELVPYYLDEANDWGCSRQMLEESLAKATAAGTIVRGLVIINPGNPTGQVLNEAGMQEIVQFCVDHGICLMADEVYQENVWKKGAKFTSFRKVAYDLDVIRTERELQAGENGLQLISFHSISKGFLGECGLRGGYFEALGIPTDVIQEVYKLASISLCSNTIGQIATGIMVQPPTSSDASFTVYKQEKEAIMASLQRRADMLSGELNQLEGVSCNTVDGALYAFPTITLPPKACAVAEERGMAPDSMYCADLLEATGIVVVAGSGFQQMPGSFHFRTTILPSEESMKDVIRLLKVFHEDFMKKYV